MHRLSYRSLHWSLSAASYPYGARHLTRDNFCPSNTYGLLPLCAFFHSPPPRGLFSGWIALRLLVMEGPPYGGPSAGTSQATGSMPLTYPTAARQGPE